uniref:Peptidase S1 domain-containing protein n=1 Tax=Glossina pallidipes TaxID=7398 RepID=A0A1A9ZJN7_GLOPL
MSFIALNNESKIYAAAPLEGLTLSKDAVLTSQQVKKGERWTCYVKYGDVDGPISRTGNVPNMIKSRGIRTYKSGPFQSPAFTPHAYILLEEEVKLNTTSAWPIPYTYCHNESNCVVVGGDKLDRSSKIVEREVCESAYPNLDVLALEEGIRLFPGGAQAVKLAKELPQQDDQCVVGTFKPRWMLLAVTIIDHNECRKKIKNLHEDHVCIRHNFPVTFDELEGGNPIICDGVLSAITTKCDCERNEFHPATPIYTFLPWILIRIGERGFSSRDKLGIFLLLLLINSSLNFEVILDVGFDDTTKAAKESVKILHLERLASVLTNTMQC